MKQDLSPEEIAKTLKGAYTFISGAQTLEGNIPLPEPPPFEIPTFPTSPCATYWALFPSERERMGRIRRLRQAYDRATPPAVTVVSLGLVPDPVRGENQ